MHAIAVAACAWAMTLGQANAENSSSISPEEIARAAADLGNSTFARREAASQLLWKAGEAAAPALREALRSRDPEVRTRAAALLDKLQFGIRPETPADVRASIEQFRFSNSPALKRQALVELRSKDQWSVILSLLKGEPDEERRKELALIVAAESAKLIQPLVEAGELDQAEEVLAMTAESSAGQAQWATFLVLTGRLDSRIAELQAQVAAAPNPTEWRKLALLLRAKGDVPGAVQAASHGGDDLLHAHLLCENGNWADAGFLFQAVSGNSEERLDQAALAITCFRLAGDAKEFETLLGTLAQTAGVETMGDAFQFAGEVNSKAQVRVWGLAETLLVNEQPERALPLLRATHPLQAHALYWRRHRHAEALQIVRIEPTTTLDRAWFDQLPAPAADNRLKTTARLSLAAQAARQLRELGRREQLDQLLETLKAVTASENNAGRSWSALATLQWQLGRFDEAFASAENAIVGRQPPAAVLSGMLKTQGPLAASWYEYFASREPAAPRADLIARSVWLVVPQPPRGKLPEDWRSMLEAAAQDGERLEPQPRAQRQMHLGSTYAARGDKEAARKRLESAAEHLPQAAMLAGHAALESQDWSAAAAWYAKAEAELGAVPRWFQGHALQQAGEAERGEQLKREANLMALAPEVRMALASEMQSHGLKEQAAEQFELVRTTVAPPSPIVVQAAQQAGNLISSQQPQQAADRWRQILLHVLHQSSSFTDPEGYLTLPQIIHKHQAKAALAAGDAAKCQQELAACETVLPGDVRLIVELVPLLDQAGQNELADGLFAPAFAVHQQVAEQFPESATYLNNTAWLAARSQRELDAALAMSEKAVALVPDEPAYLDTLAEVHFQRGDREAAVAAASKALELSPDSPLFEKRLEHFQNDELKSLDSPKD